MLKMLKNKEEFVQGFIDSYTVWHSTHKGQKLDITDRDLLFYFIEKKAYMDMTPRNFRKLYPEAYVERDAKTDVLKRLEEKIYNWVISDKQDFDKWHKETCEMFLNSFNNEVLNGRYKPIAFGKAQKIVNMTLKYLSTCDNSSDYEQHFKNAHIALDSNILDWYYKNVRKNVNVADHKIWSNLSYEEYMEIQNDFRNYFAIRNKIPFAEEWSIFGKASIKVTIYSREEIENIISNDKFPENAAVISFYDPLIENIGKNYTYVDYSKVCENVFYSETDDLDLDYLKEKGYTYETYFSEVDKLAEFIYYSVQMGMDIICQCEYGQSRSAGCAAAILEHFYHNGITVFTDYKYYPNQVIYHKVFDALEKVKESL